MPSTQDRVDQGPSFFGHELGHYLGLYHTFPYTSAGPVISLAPGETLTATEVEERLVDFIRRNGGTLAALDGDLIADTSPDPGSAFWTRHGHSASGPASVRISGTLDGTPYDYTLEPPLDNMMSYYGGLQLTPGQIDRIYRTLRHGTRAHLLPAAPESNAFLLLMAGR